MTEDPAIPAFKDHFSAQAAGYSRYRPHYPDELFRFLASVCAERARAWDCGCGNGQAAVGLAAHFAQVRATDPSERQIANATGPANVAYSVARAEASGLASGCVNLVLAAQAAHWFTFDAFFAEVRRVARPAGVVALVGYALMTIGPEIDDIVRAFYGETLGAYWPPERAHTETEYGTLPFPFAEIAFPPIAMGASWSLGHLLGFLDTWSALARYRAATGRDPLPAVAEALAAHWGDPDDEKEVVWTLFARVGRVFGD